MPWRREENHRSVHVHVGSFNQIAGSQIDTTPCRRHRLRHRLLLPATTNRTLHNRLSRHFARTLASTKHESRRFSRPKALNSTSRASKRVDTKAQQQWCTKKTLGAAHVARSGAARCITTVTHANYVAQMQRAITVLQMAMITVISRGRRTWS